MTFYPIEDSRVLGDMKIKRLVEMRNFSGQRGRGGDVTRIRLSLENNAVKELVEEKKKISRT